MKTPDGPTIGWRTEGELIANPGPGNPMQNEMLHADITAPDGAALRLNAAMYAPAATATRRRAAFFCLPGGGLTRAYFDLGATSRADYSFARAMTARGHYVVAMDHLGIGDNQAPEDLAPFTPRTAAACIAAAFDVFRRTPQLHDSFFVGLGHSMGGFMTALIQGGHAPFDAVTLLGAHAAGLDWGLDDNEKAYKDRPDALEEALLELTLKKFGSYFVQQPGPSAQSEIFGGEDADATALLKEAGAPLYATGGLMSMIRGAIKPEAESIRVPIFFAFGDRDLGGPPQKAPADFVGAPDIRLIVLPNTGHNSFGFSSIDLLCERLSAWAEDQAGMKDDGRRQAS